MSELKPCPFCGGEPAVSSQEYSTEVGETDWFWRVECLNTGCPSEPSTLADAAYKTKSNAIKAWNTRHTPQPAQADEKDNTAYICISCGNHETGFGARVGDRWACSDDCYREAINNLNEFESPPIKPAQLIEVGENLVKYARENAAKEFAGGGIIPEDICGICYHSKEESSNCSRSDCPNKTSQLLDGKTFVFDNGDYTFSGDVDVSKSIHKNGTNLAEELMKWHHCISAQARYANKDDMVKLISLVIDEVTDEINNIRVSNQSEFELLERVTKKLEVMKLRESR